MTVREKRQTKVSCVSGQTWEGAFSQEKIGRFARCKENTKRIQENKNQNFFTGSLNTNESASRRQSLQTIVSQGGPRINSARQTPTQKGGKPQKFYYITTS